MSNITLFQSGPVPTFAQHNAPDRVRELNAGAMVGTGASSVNKLSLKQAKFWMVVGGQEQAIQTLQLEVAIVRVNDGINKTFYLKEWNPNETAELPDCSSDDGIYPRADSRVRQWHDCASCPQNQWGSAVNRLTGAAGKACQDTKRMAIMPPGRDGRYAETTDLFQLAVPPASLKDFRGFVAGLGAHNPPAAYNMVVVQLSFDPTVNYPKLVFKATRWLDDQEYSTVNERYHDEETKRVAGLPEAQGRPLIPAPTAYANYPQGQAPGQQPVQQQSVQQQPQYQQPVQQQPQYQQPAQQQPQQAGQWGNQQAQPVQQQPVPMNQPVQQQPQQAGQWGGQHAQPVQQQPQQAGQWGGQQAQPVQQQPVQQQPQQAGQWGNQQAQPVQQQPAQQQPQQAGQWGNQQAQPVQQHPVADAGWDTEPQPVQQHNGHNGNANPAAVNGWPGADNAGQQPVQQQPAPQGQNGAPVRERGKPSPGRARRTAAEVAEDNAAIEAEKAAAGGQQPQQQPQQAQPQAEPNVGGWQGGDPQQVQPQPDAGAPNQPNLMEGDLQVAGWDD